ncbi:hypothetical protein [Paludibacterium purpuratum]|uniref:Uncharacterized protein n=1 Tax=Paludibacterium purpuratum TaxID=1144873 RepID=A0A4R7B500_9NEIS|nr:hypothetical protein [Paludibacterium purpuratum]TDR79730.1 hypothetical protein DFP86_10794 [Paludibacterium purpuratum]
MTVYTYDLEIILPRVVGPLREILELELKAGNSVQEVAVPWPMKQANVWLAQRFHKDYAADYPSLRYTYLGDPRNWIEEYVDVENQIMVAVSGSARF